MPVDISDTITTIEDDIISFIRIGLDIEISGENCCFKDTINDFILPLSLARYSKNTCDTFVKESLRTKLTHLSHEYLSLIDIAYDSNQNRLFEMKTLELLIEECKYNGTHLGGSRKPDGIIFTDALGNNYGVIIDTKAYSKGYSLPINQSR